MNHDPQATAAMHRADRVAERDGMEIGEVRDGFAVVSMTVRQEMTNGLGVCHGGMIFTLADTAMAYASNAAGVATLSTTATIDWLRPAYAGERLAATSVRVATRGRNEIHDVTVVGPSGDTVAILRGQTIRTSDHVTSRAAEATSDS